MNKMFIDTETSGLPNLISFNKYYPYYELKHYDSSRMIELAYIIYDSNNNKIKEFNKLIKPNNFIVTNTEIHGITNEMLNEQGESINDVLNELNKDLQTVDVIIAHNMIFDMNIILSEASRNNQKTLINTIFNKQKKCTLRYSFDFFKKRLKLTKLYEQLFNNEIIQEHRALSDVKMLIDCYLELETKYKI